ncbi:MAG: hypothetical protein KAJ25_11675, partial [Desulfobacula sp.]|nr:hypothetical protein [Desulfobacula sp.]
MTILNSFIGATLNLCFLFIINILPVMQDTLLMDQVIFVSRYKKKFNFTLRMKMKSGKKNC